MYRLTDADISEETWKLYFLLRGMRDYPFSLKKFWLPVVGPVWNGKNGVMLLGLTAPPTREAAEFLTNAQFTQMVERFFPRVLPGPARKPMGRFSPISLHRERLSA